MKHASLLKEKDLMNTPYSKRESETCLCQYHECLPSKLPRALLLRPSHQQAPWSRASPPANHEPPSDAAWHARSAQREELEALDAGSRGETAALPHRLAFSVIKEDHLLCDFRLHYLSLSSTLSLAFIFKSFLTWASCHFFENWF